jgi:hypothetical protein
VGDGSAEREELLRRQIKVMPPPRFEQLVFELARREDGSAQRLVHPDGGADTVAGPEDDRRVWQAKRYPDQINWSECEKSLDSAIARWSPNRITFVFARDFSDPVEASFQERLVVAGRKAGATVDAWTLSEIVRRLDDNQNLKERFFGSEQAPLMDQLQRVIETGGVVQSGSDLVSRVAKLGDYTDHRDPDFEYSLTPIPGERELTWDDPPYLTLEVGDNRRRVQLSTWVREGADVADPSFSFNDDEAGQAARWEAVRQLARGDAATVESGVVLRFHVPELVKEALPADARALMGAGRITIVPPEAIELELEIDHPDGRLVKSVSVRPVPPRPGGAAAYAGYTGCVLVELSVTAHEAPKVALDLKLSAEYGSEAGENRVATELLRAFASHSMMAIRSSKLLPSSGAIRGKFRGEEDPDELEWLRMMVDFYDAVEFLQGRLGESLPVPDSFTRDDVLRAITAAEVLREGGGTATFSETSGMVQKPLEIPRLADDLCKQPIRRPVIYEVFGKELNLGVGEYQLPPLKIVDIVAYGHTPDSPARVRLAPEGDDQMQFRLIGR